MATGIDFPQSNLMLGAPTPEDAAAGTVYVLPVHRYRDLDGRWQTLSKWQLTRDELADILVAMVEGNAYYWGEAVLQQRDAPRGVMDACTGAAFSMFAGIDGCSINFPLFLLELDADDVAARPELSDFEPIALDTYLHDTFQSVAPFAPEGDNPGPDTA